VAKAKEKQEQASQEQGKKGRSKLKLMLLLLTGLLLLAALGGLGYWGYQQYLAPEKDTQQTAQEGTQEQGQGKADSSSTELVSLPSMLVNLADPMGKRFIKVSIDLEVEGKKTKKRIKDNMSRIKDALILLLSSKSFSDISSMEDKLALKTEIVKRINQILDSSPVHDLYFTQFVVQ
jgi:flagellar FliL protein